MTKPNPLPSLEVLIDAFICDAESGTLSWRERKRGRQPIVGFVCRQTGYCRVSFNYKIISIHRVIWKMTTGREPTDILDHINGDKTDNRISNLREATQSQNAWNRRKEKRNSTGLKGIYKGANGTWNAQIAHYGKKIHIGCFPSPELAHGAYWQKAKELFGEFAKRE